MNKTINFFSILIFCFAINVVHAQKSVVATGGKKQLEQVELQVSQLVKSHIKVQLEIL